MSMWDDEAGYDRDDPKHPDFADLAADRADRDRKLLKEQEIMDDQMRDDERAERKEEDE